MGKRRGTTIEGVQPKSEPGKYRVRGEYVDEKTGKRREIDRIVKARDEIEAGSIRARLLDEARARRGAPRPDRTRLGDALDAWIESKKRATAPSTAERYQTAVDRWKAALGDFFLDRVEPEDVTGVLLGWRDAGMEAETINGRLRVLRTFAKDRKHARIVEGVRALAAEVEADDEEGDDTEGRGLTIDELRALLATGPTAPLHAKERAPRKLPVWWPRAWALVATLAWTGLRFGEASALRWSDVDLEQGTIRVRRAQWRGIIGHPKAKASRRTIAISSELVATLRAHRDAMVRGQLPGVDSPLVFPPRRKAKGAYVTNTHARKTMLAVCAVAKIDLGERPALHSLRHAMNNLVREHATEEVRRSIIGHAEEVETYTHVRVEEQRAAIGAVVRVIKGGS